MNPINAKVLIFSIALFGLASPFHAIEIAPATAEDIIAALGPDARGLEIDQNDLPDLFTLTSTRIDENATRFFVQGIYSGGRWKDGKAVIEYARDLSYTLVSIYDKSGRRQRIYSVKTQYGEHLARNRSRAAESREATVDVDDVVIEESPEETSSARRRRQRAEEEQAVSARESASTPAGKSETAKSSTRSSKEVASVPAATAGGTAYEWDDSVGDYVYKGTKTPVSGPVSETAKTEAKAESKAESKAEPKAESLDSSRPSQRVSRRRRTRRSTEATTESAAASATSSGVSGGPGGTSSGEVWIPKTGKSTSPADAKGAVVSAGGSTWVERPEVRSSESQPSKASPEAKASKESSSKPTSASESRTEVARYAPPPPPPELKRSESRRERRRREEREAAEMRARDASRAEAPVDADRAATSSADRREKPTSEKRASDSVERAPVAAPTAERTTVATSRREQSANLNEEHVPTTEELLAGEADVPDATPERKSETRVVPKSEAIVDSKPPTAEGDAWVPKSVKAADNTEAELQARIAKANQVASLPKRKPVDNSVENLLRISEKSNANESKEADAWVPKATAVGAANEAALSKEIQRVRAEERQRSVAASAPKVPIKKDINNPEEGVLPVSSFEKMSGPMFGRHREYERRFYPGKRPKSSAPTHDFYVDEVDRKKEFHNIYFYQYQKGKPPRLVAVQRHEKVTFRSNYDIDKEDKGKLSTYN